MRGHTAFSESLMTRPGQVPVIVAERAVDPAVTRPTLLTAATAGFELVQVTCDDVSRCNEPAASRPNAVRRTVSWGTRVGCPGTRTRSTTGPIAATVTTDVSLLPSIVAMICEVPAARPYTAAHGPPNPGPSTALTLATVGFVLVQLSNRLART